MIVRKPFDEKEILRQLSYGNESAFERVFDEFSPGIYNLALKFLDSKESAEEVVQDVFMDIWLRKDSIGEVLNFKAYLRGMARKKVYDTYRQRSTFAEVVKELSLHTQSENVIERMMQEREYEILLQKALTKLPDHQREIFRLAREEGLSHEEIAQKMNLSRLSVKAHMKRALRCLRTLLEPVLKTEASFFLLFLPGI